MTLHSANTGQDEEDYGGFRNKGHHRLVHRWAKLNKSSYLLLKGEDSIVSQERLVLQPHIDGGADPVPLVLHGYEARVQDNPQVLDGPGFKMPVPLFPVAVAQGHNSSLWIAGPSNILSSSSATQLAANISLTW